MRPFAPFNPRPVKRDASPKKTGSAPPDGAFEFDPAPAAKSKPPRRAIKPEAPPRAPELKILGRKD